jgi:excisionase family DNA binding protein
MASMNKTREIPDPAERPTISVAEAAELLGVSRATGYHACRDGELPSLRIGGRIVIPTAALRRLLQLDDA